MTKKRGPGRPTDERRLPLRTTIRASRIERLEELRRQTNKSLGALVDEQLDKADPITKKGKP